MGDHTETIQVEYFEEECSYSDLLKVFWSTHDPTRRSKTQYKSAIWWHDEHQRELAELTSKEYGKPVATTIDQFSTTSFTLAEDYHNKFLLRQKSEYFKPFSSLSLSSFVNSFTASKLNGFVSGNGKISDFKKIKDSLDYPKDLLEKLESYVEKRSQQRGYY